MHAKMLQLHPTRMMQAGVPHSPVSAVVINEGDPILVAMSGLDRQWTLDIRVDQLERSSGSVRC